MREIRRFLPNFDVFRPKNGDLWPFDPEKRSSYKLLPSVITYSEGIVARQWESLEKGVTTTKCSNLVPFYVRETVNFQYSGLKM